MAQISRLNKATAWLKNHPWLPLTIGSILYFATRLWQLRALPVFADESIYIRWAQLILHDSKYLFFALNDGKPPLYIWSLLPLLKTGLDPLWVGRFVSVILGFLSLVIGDRIVKTYQHQLKLKSNYSRLVFAIIFILSPFWFFHQRMALMDTMLVTFIMASWWGLLLLQQKTSASTKWQQLVVPTVLAGLTWGLALWTKTPALFWAPVFVLFAYWPWIKLPLTKPKWSAVARNTILFALAGLLGLLWLALLKVSPSFGSLWGRSSDFTFSWQELVQGEWQVSIDNMGRILKWLSAYLRPEVVSLPFIALLISKHKRTHLQILLAASVFFFPLAILGKTLHPRYFLPLAPFISISAALFTSEAVSLIRKSKQEIAWLIFYLLIFSFSLASLRFMLLSYFTPNQIPFVVHDREQYLTEWSSGHGILQVRDQAVAKVQDGQRLTIVTEGSFGTLPDALLMYFDQNPAIKNLKIEGLAQYPVKNIPDWVWDETNSHEVWLVVNAHRLALPPQQQDSLELIARYPRPYGAPELLVFKIQSR